MKLNIDLKKILRTGGKLDEEQAPFVERFFSLSFKKLADIAVNILKDSKITTNQISV